MSPRTSLFHPLLIPKVFPKANPTSERYSIADKGKNTWTQVSWDYCGTQLIALVGHYGVKVFMKLHSHFHET